LSAAERAYREDGDLSRIGNLVRRAYARVPGWNAWSFAHIDIWSQERRADAEAFGRYDWQQDVHLWEDRSGTLVGAVLFDHGSQAVLIGDPERRELAEPMLDWLEARHAGKGAGGESLHLEVMEQNDFLVGLLQARGYTRPAGFLRNRHKVLAGTPEEAVALPAGFRLKHMETLEEMRQRFRAAKAVFGLDDTVESYSAHRRAPSHVPELDLLIFSAQGDVAAFCNVWLDRESGIAEFEPVGTAPAYRRRGLARALLAEGCNRLRALGCRLATVDSWSESVAASGLYAKAGMEPRFDYYNWERRPG
jgi:mycothiol synthase